MFEWFDFSDTIFNLQDFTETLLRLYKDVMANMPPYTYKFVKNQSGQSNSSSSKKIGYLSKDVKVINDLIDDLSKLKTAENDAEMTNPLEINQDHDKADTPSISSSSTHKSGQSNKEKPKLKEQVTFFSTLL